MFQKADWIWICEKESGQNIYICFEDRFDYSDNTAVFADISVSGEYVLYINDSMAGFGQYGDWPELKSVNRHDITPYLHEGSNRFRLTVWHPNLDTSVSVACPARTIFEVRSEKNLLLFSHAGTPCRPDPNYISSNVPLITGQLGFSFHYDAAAEDIQPFRSAVAVSAPGAVRERPTRQLVMEPLRNGVLQAQGIYFDTDPAAEPAVRIRHAALSMRFIEEITREDGSYRAEGGNGIYLIYDLGRETAGYLSFDIDFPADAEMLIGWGEHLTDLRARTQIGSRGFAAVYHAHAGRNRFSHYFRRLGCRYIQLMIPADQVRVYSVGLYPVMYPLEKISALIGSDHLHNRIYKTGIDTLRLCIHEHYEDCPWREQALYAMDSRVQMLCGYYAFPGEKAMPKASLALMAQGQGEDGLLEICAPAKAPITIPSFSLCYPVELMEYVLYTGDLDIDPLLDAALTIDNAFLKYMVPEGYLMRLEGRRYWNFFEWKDGLEGKLGKAESTRPEGLLTAWYVYSLQACAWLCRIKGRTAQAESLDAIRAKAAAALEFFWDPDMDAYASFLEDGKPVLASELMQSIVLLTGVCGEKRAENLRRRLACRDGKPLIEVTLNDALIRYQALLQDEARYADFVFDEVADVWGRMLFENATSFWETDLGEADFSHAGSLCHGWSAVPVYLYHAYGRGIRPDAPGKLENKPVYQSRIQYL